MNSTDIQRRRLLKHLENGGSVTVASALSNKRLRIASLHSRLSELKREGHTFSKQWEKRNGSKYYRYRYSGRAAA